MELNHKPPTPAIVDAAVKEETRNSENRTSLARGAAIDCLLACQSASLGDYHVNRRPKVPPITTFLPDHLSPTEPGFLPSRNHSRVLIIGLLGGVASGKSFVADQLRRLGAVVLDADQLGHEALRQPSVIEAARRRWGERIFTADGQIDRQALARIVFAPDEKAQCELRYLENLTHPWIGERAAEMAARAAADSVPAIVLDAPLLLKAGWDKFCDKIIYVDAPYEVRLDRARQRGWNDEEFRRRESLQETLDLKRARADWVIDNSASSDATRAQIERFWHSLGG